jgi:hypothetical protein
MITPRRILDYVEAEPFKPFRVTLAGGRSYDIRHPEMVHVGRSTLRIYSIEDPDSNVREVEVSLLLTESVEPLDVARQS